MPCAANNAATLRLQRRFCRKNHMAPPPSRLPPAKPRTVSAPSPFRLSGSVSLVLAPCHSASHSAPPYPFPPHPAPPAHSLPRTFPHRLRSIPFRLSGSVSLVRLHATLHSIPLRPIPSRLILHLRPIPSRAPFRPLSLFLPAARGSTRSSPFTPVPSFTRLRPPKLFIEKAEKCAVFFVFSFPCPVFVLQIRLFHSIPTHSLPTGLTNTQ